MSRIFRILVVNPFFAAFFGMVLYAAIPFLVILPVGWTLGWFGVSAFSPEFIASYNSWGIVTLAGVLLTLMTLDDLGVPSVKTRFWRLFQG